MKKRSPEFYDELADAYEESGGACEMHAGDFEKGTAGYEAHMYAAKVLRAMAIKTQAKSTPITLDK